MDQSQSSGRGYQNQGRHNQNRSSGQNQQSNQGRPQNRHQGRRHGGRRPSSGTSVYEVVNHAARKLSNHSPFGLFMLAFLAGGLMIMGTLFGLSLIQGVSNTAAQTWLMSVGIAAGLFVIIGMNAALFNEPNVISPANLYNTTIGRGAGRLLQFWLIVWLGNFMGAMAFAWFLKMGQFYSADSINTVRDILASRVMQNAAGQPMGFFDAVYSGILGNWILGFALIYAVYNRAAVGKILILIMTVGFVVSTHLQFYPVNLSYFALLKSAGEGPGWLEIISNNLLPVSIGNLFGGAFLVALPLLFQCQRKSHRGHHGKTTNS